jgi:hypothetical protein
MYHIMHEKHGFVKKDVSILSILFQALRFICRLLVRPKLATSTVSANFSQHLNESIIHDEDTDQCEALNDTYLVPCQLPDERPDVDEIHERWSKNEEFYFDFPGFLPPVLFQHLIVQLVSHMQQQEDLIHNLESGDLPLLSKKTCLMAKDSSVRFTVKILANRIVVRHQLSDNSAENLLMEWLFQLVVDISKEKFPNLTFACGRLCPNISCLKQIAVKKGNHGAQCDFYVLESPTYKELRSRGVPAVKCLYELRSAASQQTQDDLMMPFRRSIDDLLLIARNKGHVETAFSYSSGCSNRHTVVPCMYSDPCEVLSSVHLGEQPLKQGTANNRQLISDSIVVFCSSSPNWIGGIISCNCITPCICLSST